MQSTSPRDVAATISWLLTDDVAGAVTANAVTYVDELFGRRGRPGIDMAVRAMRLALLEETVTAICVAYATELSELLTS
jgi:hypothetical protein